MRQVYIDLTTDNARLPGGDFIGYLGEHNATELLISIPQSMVDASDYQVVVIQAGPLLFKTKHIDEDRTKATYRNGNSIHTKLSKSLTKVSPLSLQVEAYKIDDEGNEALVSKTQTIPHLVLKPSPDGTPAFNYDGSFEDIEGAIENAHMHGNLNALNGFSVENEKLMFNGLPIETLSFYDTFDDLPDNASEGDIAYVHNDKVYYDDSVVEKEKDYYALAFKKEIDLEDFSIVADIQDDHESEELSVDITYRYSNLGEVVFPVYYKKGIGSLVLVPMNPIDEMNVTLFPDKYRIHYYLYNPGEEFDAFDVELTDDHVMIPHGWCKVYESETYTATGDYTIHVETESHLEIEPVEDNDELFIPIADALVWFNNAIADEDAANTLLTNIFDVINQKKSKGLYVFTDGKWLSLTDAIKKQMVFLKSYSDLDMDYPEGSIAYVTEICKFYRYDTTWISTGGGFYYLYFNPCPSDYGRCFDFSMIISYGVGYGNNFKPNGVAATIETNIASGYFYVRCLKPGKMDEYDEYIYSYEGGSVKLTDTITIQVEQGWNRLDVNEKDEVVVVHIDKWDAPHVTTGYNMMMTELNAPEYPNANNLTTDIFSTSSFIETADLRFEWLKTIGYWIPKDD